MRLPLSALALLGVLAALGCAGAPAARPAAPRRGALPARPSNAAQRPFEAALAEMARRDAAGDWTGPACAEMAARFLAAEGGSNALALYNAGLAYQRCGLRDKATELFQAALTLDDALVPALNQLALAHLAEGNAAALELARAACDRAIAINAEYAPIHNTLGLVEVKLGRFGAAAGAFDRARRLDPAFFEAHMNAAELRARLRAYEAAEDAYRAALRVRANDYDAHLGLSAALRGRIDGDEGGRGARYVAALSAIDATLLLAPERAEAYYSKAILLLDHGVAGEDHRGHEIVIVEVIGLLRTFISMAASVPRLADAGRAARARLFLVEDAVTCRFNMTEAERRALEDQRAAAEAALE